jgi:hypothetical protein
MQYSKNLGLNLPERNDQFNIDHFNENTVKTDEQLKINSDNIDTVNERLLEEIQNRESANNTLQGNIESEAVARQTADETLQSNIDNVLVDAKDLTQATGVLPVSKGGTGATSAADGFKALADGVSSNTTTPSDSDYYINLSSTTYSKRPLSALWNYITSKISSVLGLTATAYSGNAATATKLATARNFQITDGTNKGTAKSFNGTGAIELPLPTTIQSTKMRVTATSSVGKSYSDNDPFVIGSKDAGNLAMDSNDIQARQSGGLAPLYLNGAGGNVYIGGTDSKIHFRGTNMSQASYSFTDNFQELQIELNLIGTGYIGFIDLEWIYGEYGKLLVFINATDKFVKYENLHNNGNFKEIYYTFRTDKQIRMYVRLNAKHYGTIFLKMPITILDSFKVNSSETLSTGVLGTKASSLV